MSLTLTATAGGNFKPHPEGIHSAVCIDVIDLGDQTVEFQGIKSVKHMIKLVFESEQMTEEGKHYSVEKNFNASLHSKAKLTEFIGKWRGRAVTINEVINFEKLIGACCTLVISHQTNARTGRVYAQIDAISKPTKKLKPSGDYDPVARRERLAEWAAKRSGPPDRPAQPAAAPTPTPAAEFDPEVGF